jgi:hypothetical protein
MTPTNDFHRTPRRGWRRAATSAAVPAAAAAVLSSAAWLLTQVGGGVWTGVGAAAILSIDDAVIDDQPRFVGDQLVRPRGYERWVAVGASLGLSYAKAGASHEQFHQVFITPVAYDAFVRTGAFPEGTMLALEIADAGSSVLPARTGRFADRRQALEVAVKDRRRSSTGWTYYGFGDGSDAAGRPFPPTACTSCHRDHAATDQVFTQFYPRLRDARREAQ